MHSTSIGYSEEARAFIIRSTDPAVPDATLEIELGGDPTPYRTTCPACDTRLELTDRSGDQPHLTGLEYQLHYVQEHILPEIRYQETAT